MAKTATKSKESTPASATGNYTRKAVTLPALRLDEGVPTVVRITSAIRTGKVMKDRKSEDGSVMKPAKVCDATLIQADGSDGMSGVLVCGKALEESLHDSYPNNSYVGKLFEITRGVKKDLGGGRSFRPVSVVELTPA